MNPSTTEAYKCGNCGKVWFDRSVAERCCVCDSCGGTAKPGYIKCEACWNKERDADRARLVERAKKVDWKDYDGDGVYIDGLCDEYFWDYDPESIRDQYEADYEDPWPGMNAFEVWGTVKAPIDISPDWILEQLNDGAYDDYEPSHQAIKDIEDFCAEWNSRYTDYVYWPDRSVIVVYEEDVTR